MGPYTLNSDVIAPPANSRYARGKVQDANGTYTLSPGGGKSCSRGTQNRAFVITHQWIQSHTVTSKGAVKAKAKGTCFIYAYAQNGIAAKVKVTVK